MSKHSMMKGLTSALMTVVCLFLFAGIGVAQTGGGGSPVQ